jgi:dihydropteroate synthase
MENFFTEYGSVSESFLGTRKTNQSDTIHPMVVLNITPDSFSDGGKIQSPSDLEAKFNSFLSEEKQVFDIGAQSTAPTNSSITKEEELSRFKTIFFPFVEKLGVDFEGNFSIDTYRGEVFSEVYQFVKEICPKINIIWNDVSGVMDDECIDTLKKCTDAEYVFCHTTTKDRAHANNHMDQVMDERPEDVARELMNYFKGSELTLAKHDIGERTYFDPCFGFSKTKEQNLRLLRDLSWLVKKFQAERKWVIGISKKSFLEDAVKDTEYLHTVIISNWLRELGKRNILFRVHSPTVLEVAKKSAELLF